MVVDDAETAKIVWAATYIILVVLVFLFRMVNLWPMLFGAIAVGPMVGGLVTMIAGHALGTLAFIGTMIAWAYYIYGERPPPANSN